jgi:hypothetical protein
MPMSKSRKAARSASKQNGRTQEKILAELRDSAAQIRQLGAPRPIRSYWNLGQLVNELLDPSDDAPRPNITKLAKQCGWNRETLYHAAWFQRRISDKLAGKMESARDEDGRPTFSWRVVVELVSVKQPARTQLIRTAIDGKYSPALLLSEIRKATQRPPEGGPKPFRAPKRGINEFLTVLRRVKTRLGILRQAIARLQAPEYPPALARELSGVADKLRADVRETEKALKNLWGKVPEPAKPPAGR